MQTSLRGTSIDLSLPLPYYVNGKKLTPSFGNVLLMYKALDGAHSVIERAHIMCFFLFKKPKKANMDDLQAAVDLLFPKTKDGGTKAFDIIQDAQYIYAAFRQAYNINLFEVQKTLHWWEFHALLNSLPSDTKFSEIIQVRLRPMPKPTKHNADERAQLAKLKRVFALNVSEEERRNNLKSGLAKMAQFMMSKAGDNHG